MKRHMAFSTSIQSCNIKSSPLQFVLLVTNLYQLEMKQKGSITTIFGPMFSGKSTELLRQCKRHAIAKRSCITIKYAMDTRYDGNDCVVTHDKENRKAHPCMKLEQVDHIVTDFDVIAIDEGQFFPDLLRYTNKWADEGKIVIVSGLDTDFERRPFEPMSSMISMSDKKIALTAICACCNDEAPFTRRLTSDTSKELIGGNDIYEPVCRTCFNSHKLQ
jgi:thymidine kinase